MPANGRCDLIRRLKVNTNTATVYNTYGTKKSCPAIKALEYCALKS